MAAVGPWVGTSSASFAAATTCWSHPSGKCGAVCTLREVSRPWLWLGLDHLPSSIPHTFCRTGCAHCNWEPRRSLPFLLFLLLSLQTVSPDSPDSGSTVCSEGFLGAIWISSICEVEGCSVSRVAPDALVVHTTRVPRPILSRSDREAPVSEI